MHRDGRHSIANVALLTSQACSLPLQVDTTEQALQVLAAEPAPGARAAGVMMGRAAWKRPWDCFSDADRAVFHADTNAATSRRQVGSSASTAADWCSAGPSSAPCRRTNMRM